MSTLRWLWAVLRRLWRGEDMSADAIDRDTEDPGGRHG